MILEAVVVPVVLALAAGLAFIAYHHPSAYLKLLPYLAAVGIAVKFLIMTWSTALTQAEIRVIRADLPPAQSRELGSSIQELAVPYPVLFAVRMAYSFFIFALLWLRTLKQETDQS